MEQQDAATQEIARSLHQAAGGARDAVGQHLRRFALGRRDRLNGTRAVAAGRADEPATSSPAPADEIRRELGGGARCSTPAASLSSPLHVLARSRGWLQSCETSGLAWSSD